MKLLEKLKLKASANLQRSARRYIYLQSYKQGGDFMTAVPLHSGLLSNKKYHALQPRWPSRPSSTGQALYYHYFAISLCLAFVITVFRHHCLLLRFCFFTGQTLRKQWVLSLISTSVWTAGNRAMFDCSLTQIYRQPTVRRNQNHLYISRLVILYFKNNLILIILKLNLLFPWIWNHCFIRWPQWPGIWFLCPQKLDSKKGQVASPLKWQKSSQACNYWIQFSIGRISLQKYLMLLILAQHLIVSSF